MIVQIWLNGQALDLHDDTNIRQTIVANDISEIKDRQASYTNSFSVPKTANNVRVMEGLGIHSDTSKMPYIKPECQLKYDGFDLIVNGWANITETTADYKIYVYSGIINFFKEIENKTIGVYLADDLIAIDHSKTVPTVVNSFTNPAYRYLIADYGGDFLTTDEKVNIEYLMPSVNARWLWDKIHDKAGFTYTGTFMDDLDDKWITYPKAKNVDENIVEIGTAGYGITSARIVFPDTPYPWVKFTNKDFHYFVANSINASNGGVWIPYGFAMHPSVGYYGHFIVPSTGHYKIEITGSVEIGAAIPYNLFYLHLVRNGLGKTPEQAINSSAPIKAFFSVGGSFDCTFTIPVIQLSAGEQLALALKREVGKSDYQYQSSVQIKISKIEQTQISFTEELRNFAVKDFIKEMLVLYGVTVFPDENSSNLDYLKLDERLNGEVVDWSEKYLERKSEQYIYNDYAQRNRFRFKYTEKDAEYNDGFLTIENLNIPEHKVVYDSKFYSPEKELSKIKIGSTFYDSFVFKMWDKEIQRDNTIEYKSKDNRFYLINERWVTAPATLKSSLTGNEQSVTAFPMGVFSGIALQDMIDDHYPLFKNIVQDSRIHVINLNLNITDLYHLDLRKVYYFNQEQQYYFLNKLTHDEKKQEGEFVRFIRDRPIPLPPPPPEQPTSITFHVTYDSTLPYSINSGTAIKTANIFPVQNYSSFKVIELPAQGVLTYNGIAIGVNAVISSALIDAQDVFKFNAEGSYDNEFTGHYSTYFKLVGIKPDSTESAEITVFTKAKDLPKPLAPIQSCFKGIYTPETVDENGIHVFGTLEYIDSRDNLKIIEPIYADDPTVEIFAKEILVQTGVKEIICSLE